MTRPDAEALTAERRKDAPTHNSTISSYSFTQFSDFLEPDVARKQVVWLTHVTILTLSILFQDTRRCSRSSNAFMYRIR
jgi:hypothetical protein